MKNRDITLRDKVRRRAHGCCENCRVKIRRSKNGKPGNGSIHHRKPRRLNGEDSISNLVLLCLTCHREIHADEPSAAGLGWLVWTTPDLTPVRLPGGWVLLVPDGSLERLEEDEAVRLLEYVNGYVQVT